MQGESAGEHSTSESEARPDVPVRLDYANRSTPRPPRWGGRPLTAAEVALLLASCAALLILGSGATGFNSGFLGYWLYGVLLWLLALPVAVSAWLVRPPDWREHRYRSWAAALLVITVVGSFGSGVCPHARWISFGPARWAVDGRLCNNETPKPPFWLIGFDD